MNRIPWNLVQSCVTPSTAAPLARAERRRLSHNLLQSKLPLHVCTLEVQATARSGTQHNCFLHELSPTGRANFLWSSPTWLFETLVFTFLTRKRSFAPFSALLRTCIYALLRSFAPFCAVLRVSGVRPRLERPSLGTADSCQPYFSPDNPIPP